MRKRLADLCARLDCSCIVELAGAHRLAVGAAGHELVRDVHVPRVAGERVCTKARGMPEPSRGRRLALGARSRLALTGDDLQRDVETGFLVPGQPDRPRPAAAEWA